MQRLDAASLPAYFRARGWFADRAVRAVAEMSGGVSNTVLRVELADAAVIVKQPLERLKVAAEWRSDPARAANEADGLRAAGRLLPAGAAPTLRHYDDADRVLVMDAAPAGAVPWKSRLLAGVVEPALAADAGRILAALHGGSWERPEWAARFRAGFRYFEELRLGPYFEYLLPQHPTAAPRLQAILAAMRTERRCLVHGDFSPKNLLVTGADRLMLIDWEVLHYGNPLFDLGFLLTHLALKAVHVGGADPAPFFALMDTFLAAYGRALDTRAAPFAAVAPVLGALLLARVDGKSPAEYLTPAEQVHVRRWALLILVDPPTDVRGLAERLEEVSRR
ncbi:MAG: phosphotransferase [Actinomycetia bacterium]|nr:phosphotransferase [Actinomycetes bacterium]